MLCIYKIRNRLVKNVTAFETVGTVSVQTTRVE